MPMLNCYVDDRTLEILKREATDRQRGETPEHLAEAAIADAAIQAGYARDAQENLRRLSANGAN